MTSTELKPITFGPAALATLCSALWGGLAVAIRFSQDDLPPLATAGMRFAIASVFMAIWARSRGETFHIGRGQALPIAVAGLLLFAQIGTFHWGLTLTNSAHASVLIGSNPVMVALLAHFFLLGDRLSLFKLAGLLLSTVGLVGVAMGDQLATGITSGTSTTTTGDPATLWGDSVILLSSVLLGAATVNTKWALARVTAGKLLFWSYLLATLCFLVASAALENWQQMQFKLPAVLGLLYQSIVVAGFCFAAWTSLLRRHRASQLAVFGFGQPLFGMLFGWMFRGDPLTIWLAIGGTAIALGILLVTREG